MKTIVQKWFGKRYCAEPFFIELCKTRWREIPFAEVFIPVLTFAKKDSELKHRGIWANPVVTESFHAELVSLLSKAAGFCLLSDFNFIRLQYSEDKSTSNILYNEFIKRFSDQETWEDFFIEYPSLCKTIDYILQNWLQTKTILFQRIVYFLSKEGKSINDISKLQCGISDLHLNGHAACVIYIQDGQAYVYKPRNLSADALFYKSVSIINLSLQYPLTIPLFWHEDQYGWMEFIPTNSCNTIHEIEQFYHRMGTLLCMSYMLNLTDIHFENIVVNGPNPILIDAEAIATPRFKDRLVKHEKDVTGSGYKVNTVLRTNILPFPATYSKNHNNSLLVKTIPKVSVTKKFFWNHPNSDQMSVESKIVPILTHPHIPHLLNKPLAADKFISHIVRGFRECYMQIIDNRKALLSLIMEHGNVSQRVVLRSTLFYSSYIINYLQPKNLRKPNAFPEIVNGINLFHQEYLNIALSKAVSTCEAQCIETLNVPIVHSVLKSKKLMLEHTIQIFGMIEKTGLEEIKSTINNASISDCDYQTKLILEAFNI